MAVESIKVASKSEFTKDGAEMKEVTFKDDAKILLSKVNGEFFATGSKCTHYGAPLAKGVITSTGRIVCPWHGACFSASGGISGQAGDIEDAPAPRNLLSFKVEVKGDDIYVSADPEEVKKNARPTKPLGGIKKEGKGIVIIGGGSGATYAVEGLRESGYTGPIRIISKESYLPIDRTKLSKALIDDAAKLAVREESWYKENAIDLNLGTVVKSVDVQGENVTTADGQTFGYEHLILATGADPTKIPVEGKDLGNIFLLRTIDDTKAINSAIAAATVQQPEIVQTIEEKIGADKLFKPNMVIIGSSFIGMEAALAASKKANVTVVGMDKVPFEAILGPQVGDALRKNHEKQGIKFKLSAELSHFEPSSSDPSKVGSVVLKSGEKIPAAVVLVGAGVKPVTDYAQNIPGIQLDEKDKSIIVDEQLRVKGIGKNNVYAIGDIAKFPDVKTGDQMRIEHWNVAGNHGRSVASTICGKEEPYNKTAIFWSAQGAQLRYCGTSKSSKWEDVYVDGNPEELKFCAWYGKGDEVVAVATMGRDPIVSHASELFTLKKMPGFGQIKSGTDVLQIPLSA
ncbi:hypothetical protein P389DRAFT_196070 [Cystobasidium minutum MCA 4210]|uniref:uncharacterized protein n=1 Tax=Cystobasidium minutum MCA 4210 TaxID=1397322 RepID=UPI0034CDB62F|eukprot:jgi/Rhomi1/196070/gm1.4284_g